MRQANFRSCMAYACAISSVISFTIAMIFIILDVPYKHDTDVMFWNYVIMYLSSCVVYSCIIIFLIRKLDKLTIDGLVLQKNSVK